MFLWSRWYYQPVSLTPWKDYHVISVGKFNTPYCKQAVEQTNISTGGCCFDVTPQSFAWYTRKCLGIRRKKHEVDLYGSKIKEARSRFMHLEKWSLHFSRAPFANRANLLNYTTSHDTLTNLLRHSCDTLTTLLRNSCDSLLIPLE